MKSLYILERIIRNMPYKTIVDQREYIENNLQTQLNDSLRKYGIGVERVALKNILEDSVLVSCVDKSSNETHKCTSEEVGKKYNARIKILIHNDQTENYDVAEIISGIKK